MLFKLIVFAAAAIPAILFLRSIFVRQPSRFSLAAHEFRRHVDIAVYILLGLIGCVVAVAVGKLAWAWWTSL
jgi:hypothetical protein